jgi:hypothetical protein
VPEDDVSWRVTTAGRLEVSWLRRVSQFAGGNRVELSWRGEGGEGGSVEGSVARAVIPRLRLGRHYTATLLDLQEEDSMATFAFTASQCSAMQCSTVQHSAGQCSAVQCSAAQCSAGQ